MRQTVREMCETILGGESDVVPLAGGEEEAEGGGGGATLDDVDERIEEFLCTIPVEVAEATLRECATLDFTGVRSRSAYLMGVLKRKVADSDRLGGGEGENRQPRGGGGGGGKGGGKGGGRGGGGKGGGRGRGAASAPPPEGKHTKFPAFSPVPPKKPKPKAGGAGSALLDL